MYRDYKALSFRRFSYAGHVYAVMYRMATETAYPGIRRPKLIIYRNVKIIAAAIM